MELVPRQLRPAFASMINLAAGLASILSGWFTGNVLFVEQEGYRTAYYIASGIYVVACMLLMAGLWKYNRAAPNKEEGDHETLRFRCTKAGAASAADP